MKQFFAILVLLLTIQFVSAQRTAIVKTFAFAQSVTPGARPQTGVEENGTEVKVPVKERLSYFMYAEQLRSTDIRMVSVWIKGKSYSVKADTVAKSPVEMVAGEGTETQNLTLVPATRNKLWILTPGQAIQKPATPSTTLRNLIRKNEMVLVYRWKGKLWYSTVKKITALPPVLAV